MVSFTRIFSSLVFLQRRLKEPSSILAMAYLSDKFGIGISDVAPLLTTGLGFLAFFVPECPPLTKVNTD